MKHILIFVIALLTTDLSATGSKGGCTRPYEVPSRLTIININDLTEADLDQIIQGYSPEIAIEFLAGTLLPIHFFPEEALPDGGVYSLYVQQTFYLRYVEDAFFFSTNLKKWTSLTE